MNRKWPLGNYGLSIVLAILFLVSWLIQTWAGWVKFAQEAASKGETPSFFGESAYVYEWLAATFENWQSEFLQLLTFVILTALLIHKGSHESKDTDVEFEERLSRIEEKLDRLREER